MTSSIDIDISDWQEYHRGMSTLQQLAPRNPLWPLDDFVQVVNQFLPQFLPEEKSHTRVREEVTPRLVRHYTSLGLLEEPLKLGREARYSYRHLLQVLLVRRLLVEGYGASAIDTLAKSKSNEELEGLLQGGVVLTLTPANPALHFLQNIRQRSAKGPAVTAPAPDQISPSFAQPSLSSQRPSTWTRLEIIPGLELHVRRDFTLPATQQEQQNLLQVILHHLLSLTSKGAPKP